MQCCHLVDEWRIIFCQDVDRKSPSALLTMGCYPSERIWFARLIQFRYPRIDFPSIRRYQGGNSVQSFQCWCSSSFRLWPQEGARGEPSRWTESPASRSGQRRSTSRGATWRPPSSQQVESIASEISPKQSSRRFTLFQCLLKEKEKKNLNVVKGCKCTWNIAQNNILTILILTVIVHALSWIWMALGFICSLWFLSKN